MRKLLLCLLAILLFAGCARRNDGAAAHLGDPVTVQLQAQGYRTAYIREKPDIRRLMNILSRIEVRPLAPEEEIELIFRQGKTADAVELRFKDINRQVYKALFLKDGSLLVVDGVRGSAGRRNLFLSPPGQEALQTYLRAYLEQQQTTRD
jgi:hypothetical protein